jgi:putative NADH-flavin reductase
MRVAVPGATGRTGLLLVGELLRRDHDVTVLVRSPDRLGELAARVRIVVGESRDRSALAELVVDADAVISTLGPKGKDATLLRDTAAELVPVMGEAGVDRFIGISGAALRLPDDRRGAVAAVMSWLVRTIGGGVIEDKPAEYRTYAASGMQWTLVRPQRMKEGPATGAVYHDAHRSPRTSTISRSDLAVFLADALDEQLYFQQAPFVASGPS